MRNYFTVLLGICFMMCGRLAADQTENEELVTAYISEEIEYRDEVIPVQYVDDLSLLADMKYTDGTYVCQDGRLYYRRYHEDSFEETALWGIYDPVSDKKKEIVCIDMDGTETVLFTDEGYGDMYLLDDRFYMREEVKTEQLLYSVDMQGKDRIDYGNGRIFAIDKERHIIILEMFEKKEGKRYYALNYKTGEKKLILTDGEDHYFYNAEMYQDGWLYYERSKMYDAGVFGLWAVSLEGGQRKIIAFTSEFNLGSYGYTEHILNVKSDGERIYFIIGGYDGSASVFQGGKLVSVNLDGTDYKAVETPGDIYYIGHDKGKAFVYFPYYALPLADNVQECDTMVWDVESDTCFLSEFPQEMIWAYDQQEDWVWRDASGSIGVLLEPSLFYEAIGEKKVDIYAVPDDSGRIVRVAMNLDESIAEYEDGEVDRVKYKDLYYADGFLYVTAEYSVYDKDSSIGWRDGYRRLRSDVYRLKMGEREAELLYSY